MTQIGPETDPEDAGTTGTQPVFDAPEDTSEELSRGYAVYDRDLGRYVSGVTEDKPKAADAKKTAKGHHYAIVRV